MIRSKYDMHFQSFFFHLTLTHIFIWYFRYTIAEDIFSSGYKGGEGSRFYESSGELSDDIHQESFRADIISFLVPYRTNQPNGPRIQNPISLTGKLHPVLYQNTDIPERETQSSLYPGARYNTEKLQLKDMTSYASDASEFFLSPFRYLNDVCWQGPQYYYSNLTGRYARIRGTGHWEDNAYAGCKSVRSGDMDYFREVQQNDESPI